MILRAMLAVAYATGRVSHARQVKGDDPDKKRYSGPPGWGFGMGLTTPPSKKIIVTKVEQRKKLDRLNDDGRKETRYTEKTLATWNVQTMLKPGREGTRRWGRPKKRWKEEVERDLQVLGVRRWR